MEMVDIHFTVRHNDGKEIADRVYTMIQQLMEKEKFEKDGEAFALKSNDVFSWVRMKEDLNPNKEE